MLCIRSTISFHHAIYVKEAVDYKGSQDPNFYYLAASNQRTWLASMSPMYPRYPKVIMQNGVTEQPTSDDLHWSQRPAL